MQEEIYIQIEEFPNYQVSNLGNVRNIKTELVLKQRLRKDGYKDVMLNLEGKRHNKKVHRLVANAFLENIDNKKCVDHINNNKEDNNINNLRYATMNENGQNRRLGKNNTSGYKGVSFNKKLDKWHARIMIDGIPVHLGYYATIEEAKQARQDAVKKAFGEFTNACELM